LNAFKPHSALRAAGGAILLALGFAASAQAAGPAADQDKGRRFYEKVCARCHEAGIGPVLLGRGLPPAIFTTIARSGLNAMPAFRVTDVDDDTLQAVAEYLSMSAAKN